MAGNYKRLILILITIVIFNIEEWEKRALPMPHPEYRDTGMGTN